MRRLTQLVLLIGLCNCACCYNILAIISMPLKSHYMAFGDLFRELATRGHSVTVVNHFPDETPVPNLQFISLGQTNTGANVFPRLDFYEAFDSRFLPHYNLYRHLSGDILKRDCEKLFSNAKMQSIKGIKYDLIFVEQFMSDCGLALAGAVFDAPIIGITSHVFLPWAYSRLGLPFNSAADPFYFTTGGPNPAFFQRVETFLYHHIFNSIGKWLIQNQIYETFNKHFVDYKLDIEKIELDRLKMIFSYQHFSFTGARVLSPQVLEIAGLHVKKPKALPENIESFLNKAEHGAVYICFGSNLKLSTMSEKKLREFLEAFKRIHPLKVLVKWENRTIDAENVLTGSWFPQLDLLCHPKVIAFVSHGGMLSITEAASCGVPMIAVPFFGDQFGNAAMLESSGMGTVLNFEQITGDTLSKAIKMITSKRVQERAKEISLQWHDRPMSVMDSAIYWTEYVARHPNAPPTLPSKHSSWFESSLIDVYATVLVLLLIIFLVVHLFFKLLLAVTVLLFRKCVSSKHKTD